VIGAALVELLSSFAQRVFEIGDRRGKRTARVENGAEIAQSEPVWRVIEDDCWCC
jgi:hypothetical protein